MICVDTDEYEQALHAGTAQGLVEEPHFLLLREIDDNNPDLNEQIFFCFEERLYKNKSPNAQTLAAIEDVNNNRNLFGPFKNVEDMMNELNGRSSHMETTEIKDIKLSLKSEDTVMSPAIRLIWQRRGSLLRLPDENALLDTIKLTGGILYALISRK